MKNRFIEISYLFYVRNWTKGRWEAWVLGMLRFSDWRIEPQSALMWLILVSNPSAFVNLPIPEIPVMLSAWNISVSKIRSFLIALLGKTVCHNSQLMLTLMPTKLIDFSTNISLELGRKFTICKTTFRKVWDEVYNEPLGKCWQYFNLWVLFK